MKYENHPCFNEGARHTAGRIHLPVATKCNVQCNYCNRNFDCINESRPGVSSAVLEPCQAVDYLDDVLDRIKNIAVVGIAGPGDPFANPEKTLETLYMVRERHPNLMLCVATNGLALADFVNELARLKVGHVTVTVNAVASIIGERIYAWARLKDSNFRGIDAADVILTNQLEAIRCLKAKGVTVKINTVVIPGINDNHVIDIARTMNELGVDIMNCIPMYQVEGTVFESVDPPTPSVMHELRQQAGVFIHQMGHCSRCRADAAGLIGEKMDGGIRRLLLEAAERPPFEHRPHEAIVS